MAHNGQFLHDFSYAGYQRGEKDIPWVESPVVSVEAYGADSTGTTDSTQAFQQAIDALPEGGLVSIPPGLFVFDGQIKIRKSGVVIRGAGRQTQLHFRKTAGMSNQAHIEFLGTQTATHETLLASDATTWETVVKVQNAAGYAPGDDVAIGWKISDAFVAQHNMTGTWQAFNGRWQMFFWRTVTRVNTNVTPHELEFDIPLRYPALTRDGASVRKVTGYVSECGLEDVAVSTSTDKAKAWALELTHAVRFQFSKDCWLRNVHSFAARGYTAHLASGGVKVLSSKRLTLEGSNMAKAENRGGGGNGYLFEISQSGEVLLKNNIADGGRHNFIQNWGFGTSGCVFLRCQSRNGRALIADWDFVGITGFSEFHHSLAMGNLVDQGEYDDGFEAKNRGSYSSGAGHTSTQNVFWNVGGKGVLRSRQFGWGYVIGPRAPVAVDVSSSEAGNPVDVVERVPDGKTLTPASLYESQRARRISF